MASTPPAGIPQQRHGRRLLAYPMVGLTVLALVLGVEVRSLFSGCNSE